MRTRTGPEEAAPSEALPAGLVSSTMLVSQSKSVFTCRRTPCLHLYWFRLLIIMFNAGVYDMQHRLKAISLMQIMRIALQGPMQEPDTYCRKEEGWRWKE